MKGGLNCSAGSGLVNIVTEMGTVTVSAQQMVQESSRIASPDNN